MLGCPRSGTTLLQLMLHAHPRLAVPPENRHVLPAYARRAEWGDLTAEANRRRLATFITGKRSAIWELGPAPAAVRERIVAGPPTLGSALEVVMRAFAEHVGARRWCDKRPLYVRHIHALRRLFPGAAFIHVIRDGRAAAASLARMPWYKHGLEQAIGTWLLAVHHADAARDKLPAGTWLDLRYEDLLVEPEKELVRLCEFLGEDFDAAMLSPADVKATLVPERKTWHANTGGPLLLERAESWRRELDPADIAFLEAVAGRELAGAGYRTGGVDRGPDLRRVAHFALAYRRRRFWHLRQAAAEARAARREPYELASHFGLP